MSKKKNKEDDLLLAGTSGASYETVQRYGSAIKEHLVAYDGIDNEAINSVTGKAQELKKV